MRLEKALANPLPDIAKPSRVFDREAEWAGLAAFASRPTPHAMLGVVSGRRRMGKTYLLRALVEQLGGFYFAATAATEGESLRQFGAALAKYAGSPVSFSFANWDDAVSYLFSMAAPGRANEPLLVVIDEFPYLAKTAAELPSLIQREMDRFQIEENRLRLLLCGSAMSVMGGLLSSTAPLRGRAQMELVVSPFGYRSAAEFWGVTDEPQLAARLHAVLGGTPAYRRQFLAESLTDGGATSRRSQRAELTAIRLSSSSVSAAFRPSAERRARYRLIEAMTRSPCMNRAV